MKNATINKDGRFSINMDQGTREEWVCAIWACQVQGSVEMSGLEMSGLEMSISGEYEHGSDTEI